MTGGFTFDGIDIADIGVEYIPEKKNVYPFNQSSYNVHDKTVEGHDGGYFFGTTVQPKQFDLKCFFEETALYDGIMTKINMLFKRGRTGKLIFKDREWLYYNATVISVDFSNVINIKSMTFNVTMRAYYPFARSTILALTTESEDIKTDVKNNSEIMEGINWNRTLFAYNSSLPQSGSSITIQDSYDISYYIGTNGTVTDNAITINGSSSNQIVNTDGYTAPTSVSDDYHRTFFLFNPGTEDAHALIYIKGYSTNGMKLQVTDKENCCIFSSFGSSTETYELKCDALNGKTVVKKPVSSGTAVWENGFLYHDSGFITVPSSYGEVTKIEGVTFTSGNTSIAVSENYSSLVGQYVFISDCSSFCGNGYMAKINSTDSTTIVMDSASTISGTKDIYVIPMTKVVLTSNGGTTVLDSIDITYVPTFS